MSVWIQEYKGLQRLNEFAINQQLNDLGWRVFWLRLDFAQCPSGLPDPNLCQAIRHNILRSQLKTNQ